MCMTKNGITCIGAQHDTTRKSPDFRVQFHSLALLADKSVKDPARSRVDVSRNSPGGSRLRLKRRPPLPTKQSGSWLGGSLSEAMA
ncbi:hypothetical protein N7454_000381 [Penicillium verhagenii]|nr:hypothetical protein N7454_000381 [Penicillium verhagenii]